MGSEMCIRDRTTLRRRRRSRDRLRERCAAGVPPRRRATSARVSRTRSASMDTRCAVRSRLASRRSPRALVRPRARARRRTSPTACLRSSGSGSTRTFSARAARAPARKAGAARAPAVSWAACPSARAAHARGARHPRGGVRSWRDGQNGVDTFTLSKVNGVDTFTLSKVNGVDTFTLSKVCGGAQHSRRGETRREVARVVMTRDRSVRAESLCARLCADPTLRAPFGHGRGRGRGVGGAVHSAAGVQLGCTP